MFEIKITHEITLSPEAPALVRDLTLAMRGPIAAPKSDDSPCQSIPEKITPAGGANHRPGAERIVTQPFRGAA